MAVEAKRGCGYRKVGGLYLVSDGLGIPCDRLPITLEVCPCCGAGIKPARGWTWVDVPTLVKGNHMVAGVVPDPSGRGTTPNAVPCGCPHFCPLCHNVALIGKAGLI